MCMSVGGGGGGGGLYYDQGFPIGHSSLKSGVLEI